MVEVAYCHIRKHETLDLDRDYNHLCREIILRVSVQLISKDTLLHRYVSHLQDIIFVQDLADLRVFILDIQEICFDPERQRISNLEHHNRDKKVEDLFVSDHELW